MTNLKSTDDNQDNTSDNSSICNDYNGNEMFDSFAVALTKSITHSKQDNNNIDDDDENDENDANLFNINSAPKKRGRPPRASKITQAVRPPRKRSIGSK